MWKQNRLGCALNSAASLLIDSNHDRAALERLGESRRIVERLGFSDRGDVDVYAPTLVLIGVADRDLGSRQMFDITKESSR